MGGMFTVLKTRDGIRSYEDPGWYDNPAGTLATTEAPGISPPKKTTRPGIFW